MAQTKPQTLDANYYLQMLNTYAVITTTTYNYGRVPIVSCPLMLICQRNVLSISIIQHHRIRCGCGLAGQKRAGCRGGGAARCCPLVCCAACA
eukprot:scaffold1710_cov126-Isochrysis_galbana.AAC.4